MSENKCECLPFIINGIVRHGKQMGRTLGFPTINLLWDGSVSLPFGVYVSEVTANSAVYMGVTNIGVHPTLPAGGLTAETYLLDVKVDLYDKPVQIKLLAFTRAEQRFDSVDALKAQLKNDVESARNYFRVHQLR